MFRGAFATLHNPSLPPSPAGFGALGIEEEAAEAVPEREAREQHRADPHQQPQRPAPPPPGTPAAYRHLAVGRNCSRIPAYQPACPRSVTASRLPRSLRQNAPIGNWHCSAKGSHVAFYTRTSQSQGRSCWHVGQPFLGRPISTQLNIA